MLPSSSRCDAEDCRMQSHRVLGLESTMLAIGHVNVANIECLTNDGPLTVYPARSIQNAVHSRMWQLSFLLETGTETHMRATVPDCTSEPGRRGAPSFLSGRAKLCLPPQLSYVRLSPITAESLVTSLIYYQSQEGLRTRILHTTFPACPTLCACNHSRLQIKPSTVSDCNSFFSNLADLQPSTNRHSHFRFRASELPTFSPQEAPRSLYKPFVFHCPRYLPIHTRPSLSSTSSASTTLQSTRTQPCFASKSPPCFSPCSPSRPRSTLQRT